MSARTVINERAVRVMAKKSGEDVYEMIGRCVIKTYAPEPGKPLKEITISDARSHTVLAVECYKLSMKPKTGEAAGEVGRFVDGDKDAQMVPFNIVDLNDAVISAIGLSAIRHPNEEPLAMLQRGLRDAAVNARPGV